jgi:hypothetical protein
MSREFRVSLTLIAAGISFDDGINNRLNGSTPFKHFSRDNRSLIRAISIPARVFGYSSGAAMEFHGDCDLVENAERYI